VDPTLPEAEALLDCLATYGHSPLTVAVREDGFAVRCPASGVGR
jgi:hypothetical protein